MYSSRRARSRRFEYLSAGMLAKARALCARQGWTNVELAQEDAAAYAAPMELSVWLNFNHAVEFYAPVGPSEFLAPFKAAI